MSCSKRTSSWSGYIHVNNTDIKSGFLFWHCRWAQTCRYTVISIYLHVNMVYFCLFAGFSLSTFKFVCLLSFWPVCCPSLSFTVVAWKKPGLMTRGAGAEITSRLCKALGSRDMKAGQWGPSRGMPGQGRVSGRLMILLCCLRARGLLTGAGTEKNSDKSNWKHH